MRNSQEPRSEVAKAHGVLEQNVMNDRVLNAIRKSNPTTLEDLWLIDGISSEFISKYGQSYLNALSSSSTDLLKPKTKKNSTKIGESIKYTIDLVQKGNAIKDIAAIRSLKSITIENHISEWWGSHPGRNRYGLSFPDR